MKINIKRVHWILGTAVFLFEFIVLFLTVQPSVSFWDCGELSAASIALGITHPPGAPFFLMVNHILSLIPFAANIGFRVNMLTVIVSSFSVLFCYLVAVKIINNWRKKDDAEAGGNEKIITYITSAIGALSFGFANSFWFNATESNVFGFSTFLYTLMIWLMMIWYEKADQKGSDRYLLLVAFILGLSPGVHLMSVLAGVTLGMLYVFRRIFTDDNITIQTAKIFLINIGVLLAAAFFMWSQQTGTTPPQPEEYRDFDFKFKVIMLVISVIIMGIYYKKTLNRSSFYWAFIAGMAINFAIYPGMVKYLPAIIVAIGGNSLFENVVILFVFLAILFYIAYWAHENKRFTVHLISMGAIVAIIGFSVYCYIIIRANQHPAMNENNPNDVTTLVSYLNREQYGEFPTFRRRFSAEPQHKPVWQDYSSDLDYFLKWQMNHMYNRYLFWNFIGRQSWQQDAGVNFSQLFGIPFIIGMLGLLYHFRRDWKMASIFLTAFIFMGYLICFYQNQQQMQPRDREYFYSGSWFVFALWIAIGLRGIIEDIKRYVNKPGTSKALGYTVIAAAFLIIPMNMLRTNYPQEDRSKNWIPWDYSYNLLQSCAPNSILFTCGDNDTFPLWYLQDAEGYRRDIRIVNTSLLNTNWYIKELKNETPYGSMKVPMSFSDDQIDKLQPMEWQTKNIDVSVPKNVFDEFGIKDSSQINRGKITFTMRPTLNYGNVGGVRVQDIVTRDIIMTNKWQRPIYFAVSCGDDSKIGLGDYLRLDGLAQRLTPIKSKENANVDTAICSANMLNTGVQPSKNYQPGFIIRSFSNPGVFLDENQLRTADQYRNSYIFLASYYATDAGKPQMAEKVLNKLEELFPHSHVPMDYRLKFNLATLYYAMGNTAHFNEVKTEVEKEALASIAENPANVSSYYNPYLILKALYEYSGEFDKEIDILNKMTLVTGKSPEIQNEIMRVVKLKDSLKSGK